MEHLRGVSAGSADAGWTWVHLRRDHAAADDWLREVASVDEVRRGAAPPQRSAAAHVQIWTRGFSLPCGALTRCRARISHACARAQASREALLSTESRPRCVAGLGRSLVLRLRGLHRRYRPAGERDAPPAAPLPADEECPPEPPEAAASAAPPPNGAADGHWRGAAGAPSGGSSPAAAPAAGALEEYNDLYAITLLIQPDKARPRLPRGCRCFGAALVAGPARE